MGTSGVVLEPGVGGVKRGGAGEAGEVLDLFLRRRGAALIGSLGESGAQNGRIKNMSVGPAIPGRSRMEDLLDADMGKHDYDWLLTPPGTPVIPSSNAAGKQISPVASKDRSTVRSASTVRASRLSASQQQENGSSTKPIRSSSAVRPSISSSHSSSLLYNNRTSALNTSTASVTSRPSTPSRSSTHVNRSASVSSSVPRSAQARPVNPAKTRPTPASAGDKPRPLQNSRPSTPTSRPQISSNSTANLNSSLVRPGSRPSTPTRRPTTPVNSSYVAPTVGRSPSAGRPPSNRNSGLSSRPSSPGPRLRAPVRPIDLPDFPLDAPPNLRTKLPERSASSGRTRPGMALTVRTSSNTEPPAPAAPNRRPVIARSKLPEKSTKLHPVVNDHEPVLLEIQKPMDPEPGVRRSTKTGGTKTSTADSAGFGRTISKMSLDMALRHMDIRQNMGGIRAASLFPHSIRPSAAKARATRGSEPIVPVANDQLPVDDKSCISTGREVSTAQNGNPVAKTMNKGRLVAKESDSDLSGSSRYDALLLKEDLKNTNWLHSAEEYFDQSPVFDHRFEPVPEPFGPF